jgi:hypothetical protein
MRFLALPRMHPMFSAVRRCEDENGLLCMFLNVPDMHARALRAWP